MIQEMIPADDKRTIYAFDRLQKFICVHLPDAGEDESDESDYCRRCGAMLTECDEEMGACTQCRFRLRGKEQWKQ